MLAAGQNTASQIIVKLGATNALPTTTVVTIDGGDGIGTGRFAEINMNGFSQALAGLTNTTRTLRFQRVVNSNLSAAATLTIDDSSNSTFVGNLGSNSPNGSVSVTAMGVGATDGNNFGLTKNGTGVFTLNGNNTYTGATTINGGTLALGASGSISTSSDVVLGTGTFDVSAKAGYSVADLSGSGSVVGALTVTNNLAIGSSPGTVGFEDLTLADTATFTYEVTGGGSTADLGNVSGALDITDSTLSMVQLGTYTQNDKFTLFGYTTGNLTGTFLGLADGATFNTAGGDWQINYNDSSAGSNGGTGDLFVTVTAVPEPSTLMILGAGAALLGLRFARRRL